MKNCIHNLFISTLSIVLIGCASNPTLVRTSPTAPATEVKTQGPQLTPISGPAIGLGSMDSEDRNKMSHALDKGLGKSTEWVSLRTGIKYSVIPIQKITYQNNPFCRKYNVTVSRNASSQTYSGTACVSATDNNWKVVQ